ncbi:hypothetical protein KQY30_23360 [Streptomyces sp. GMY02]|uniref:hypothetical protein n=1 Tax=Streptomyces sp. GMY02 TaxID=1333528 RepID=UPI001C2C46EC|nr:hypothetical protein [Streptomyces sp. GMY02]QXE36710.1 hypothetical protein KQY30_23360 [Streptomyces sp. GMY02]
MRRGLVHAMAWSLATGAAVTLSWWGVRTVMTGTAYDPPRALALPTDSSANSTARPPSPLVSSTRRPPSPSAAPSPRAKPRTAETVTPTPAETATHSDPPAPYPSQGAPEPSTGASEPPASGEVKSYTVDGGRVAFDMGPVSAELVSATPDAGWQMQVWTQPYWIRVTFTRDGREVSVFCTWNDHPPMVQFDDR